MERVSNPREEIQRVCRPQGPPQAPAGASSSHTGLATSETSAQHLLASVSTFFPPVLPVCGWCLLVVGWLLSQSCLFGLLPFCPGWFVVCVCVRVHVALNQVLVAACLLRASGLSWCCLYFSFACGLTEGAPCFPTAAS